MFRLLSWTGCDKISSPDLRMFVSQKDAPGGSHPTIPPTLKRKPVAHGDESETKRAKITDTTTSAPSSHEIPTHRGMTITPSSAKDAISFLPSPPDHSDDVSQGAASTAAEWDALEEPAAPRTEAMRNVLQTQIGLEILLKHQELRLVDQEIAKCQVALEQLRRCQEIPYPVTQPPSVAVSNGTGSALRRSFPVPLPASPAPWGVTDGPYTRHYARWLLPDPRFDGGEPEPVIGTHVGKSPMVFRSMRASFTEVTPSLNSPRSQRSGKLKSLPAGYAQPKEKATGPMVVKRKSDGVMVKLICPDCGRHDFGSAQGFINHCRIGHGRSFASHDAAAEACGEPAEFDESGAVVGAERVTPATTGNVHPLIRSAKLLPPTAPRTSTPSYLDKEGGRSSQETEVSPGFRGSHLTPNLSELVKNSGLGLDLQEIVMDAKTKVEAPESESEEDDTDTDTPVPSVTHGRHPHVAGTKQVTKPAKSHGSSPVMSTTVPRSPSNLRTGPLTGFDGSHDAKFHSRTRDMTLPIHNAATSDLPPSDPSPTSESNQAPSLVDDDEEYEPHSPSSSSISDEHDLGEVDFEVQGDDDDARSVLQTPDFQPACAQTTRPGDLRRPSALRRQDEEREEKHVSFVSPGPAGNVALNRPSGQRRRRKA